MRWVSRPGWPGHLLVFTVGTLAPLALAPFDYWPLAILPIALLYLGSRGLPGKSALQYGWWYGFGAFGAGTSWIYVSIHDYGAASVPLASFPMLGFTAGVVFLFALPTWLWVRCLRRDSTPLGDVLALAALWLALELFRSWFLTGFPWLYAGYSQSQGPSAGLVPMGNVWLSSPVITLSTALLVNLSRLFPYGASLPLGLVLLLGPWVAGLYLKGHAWTHSAGEPLRVVVIQGNIAQELRWDPNQVRTQLDLYHDLSLPQQDVDLIVWSETAVLILQDTVSGYLDAMGQAADEKNAVLITGVPVREHLADGKSRHFSGIIVAGEGTGTYPKQKLVSFGEYAPLQDLSRGLTTFFDLLVPDFARGPANQLLLKAKGYEIASYIRYEVVYPEFAAVLATQSQVLLTVSNDTWFSTSIGPLQHLQMVQTRILESGRWMIHATNNGVAGLINPYGRIVWQISQFQQGTLCSEVTPMQGLTPYLQYRVRSLIGLAGVLLLWALFGRQLRLQERRLFGWSQSSLDRPAPLWRQSRLSGRTGDS